MLSRRSFLKSSSLLALAPTVPGFLANTARAARPERDGRVLVVLQLNGGNDGINTVVPYADEGYAKHRKVLRLPTDRLLKINDHVGLHSALRSAADLLESGRLAIVQGVGYPNPNRSHFESMAIWQTARFDPQEKNLGWLGRALDDGRPPADRSPSALHVGLDAPTVALQGRRAVSSALARLDDLALPAGVNSRPATGGASGGADVKAFVRRSLLDAYITADRLHEAARVPDTATGYPEGALGGSLRLMARLLKAGFGTRVFYATHTGQGYDTHQFQLATHAGLLAELGGSLRAFLDDLKAARLAERVVVLVFSEFGRRVAENASQGTDHGTAGPVLVAGAGVKAGLVGKTPSLLDLEAGDLKMSVDFRRVYATVLEDWLGLPAKAALAGSYERPALFRA
jgi:uncharacterized protein (DUF1501 family)